MSFRVVILNAAERDIEAAIGWYLDNAPEHSEPFASDLRETIGRLEESPRLFRTVHGDVRRAALRRFPYLVWLICFDEANTVHVLAVTHQRQSPEGTRRRLG